MEVRDDKMLESCLKAFSINMYTPYLQSKSGATVEARTLKPFIEDLLNSNHYYRIEILKTMIEISLPGTTLYYIREEETNNGCNKDSENTCDHFQDWWGS